jgi:hypothetical protein
VLFRPKFSLKNTSYYPNVVIDRNVTNSLRQEGEVEAYARRGKGEERREKGEEKEGIDEGTKTKGREGWYCGFAWFIGEVIPRE